MANIKITEAHPIFAFAQRYDVMAECKKRRKAVPILYRFRSIGDRTQ